MSRMLILAGASALMASGLYFAGPALAADGEILITQAKALAGNVTPGDAAGFPVTLSLPGSYKLASNLSPGPNLNGIIAAAPDISIDLNGFRMSGGPAGGTNNSLIGILDQGDRLSVKNGTIGAFETTGISALSRLFLIVENMRIINSGVGIDNNGGNFTRIQNSTIASNVGVGVFCGFSCHLEGSVLSNNGYDGIHMTSGTVLGNTIISNGHFGIISSTIVLTHGIVGFGNNTINNNNNRGTQVYGFLTKLYPNACSPAC